jgi:multimeric flavodoxin WrbA
MNALILNGDLPEQNTLLPIQEELIEELESNKWDTEAIVLNQVKIKNCIGCLRCWHSTPGICTGIKGDEADEIIQKVINSDLVIFLTPLTFGGYSSELKKIIGRLLGLLQPGTRARVRMEE